ncbi:MAG: RNA polymerase sigma factor [Bacteroidales bacterium]
MNKQNDNFYISKVLQGDVNAYAGLVEKHKEMVYSLAYRIVQNREDAEEIAQDAFIKAYQSLGSFKKESKFSTWLFRIVYNTSISRTRKRKVETQSLDNYTLENYSEDEMKEDLNRLNNNEQKKLINEVLSTLNPDEQFLITLYYFKDQTIDELSQVLSLTRSNVKIKLFRIRKKLQIEIGNRLEKQNKEILI